MREPLTAEFLEAHSSREDVLDLCDPDWPEALRIEAAARLAEESPFAWPIFGKRFRALERALMRELASRAELHGLTWRRELAAATVKALVQAGAEIDLDDERYHDPRDLVRQVRRRVNDLVTVDLLGEDWRRQDRIAEDEPEETDLGPQEDAAPAELEAIDTLVHVIRAAGLSDRDGALWVAVEFRDERIADVAHRLGMSRAAADVALHRARGRVKETLASL